MTEFNVVSEKKMLPVKKKCCEKECQARSTSDRYCKEDFGNKTFLLSNGKRISGIFWGLPSKRVQSKGSIIESKEDNKKDSALTVSTNGTR